MYTMYIMVPIVHSMVLCILKSSKRIDLMLSVLTLPSRKLWDVLNISVTLIMVMIS